MNRRHLLVLLRKDMISIVRHPAILGMIITISLLSPIICCLRMGLQPNAMKSVTSTIVHSSAKKESPTQIETAASTQKAEERTFKIALLEVDKDLRSRFDGSKVFEVVSLEQSTPGQAVLDGTVAAVIDGRPNPTAAETGEAATAGKEIKIWYRLFGQPELSAKLSTVLDSYDEGRSHNFKKPAKQAASQDWWHNWSFQYEVSKDAESALEENNATALMATYLLFVGIYTLIYTQGFLCNVVIINDNADQTATTIMLTPVNRRLIALAKGILVQAFSLAMCGCFLLSVFSSLTFGAQTHPLSPLCVLRVCVAALCILAITAPALTTTACGSASVYSFLARFVIFQSVMLASMIAGFLPCTWDAPALALVPIVNASVCINHLLNTGDCNWFFYLTTIISSVTFAMSGIFMGADLIDPEFIVTGHRSAFNERVDALVLVAKTAVVLLLMAIFAGLSLVVIMPQTGSCIWAALIFLSGCVVVWSKKLPWHEAFGLARVAPFFALAAIPTGALLALINHQVDRWLQALVPLHDTILLSQHHSIAMHSRIQSVLSFAVLPALAEELVFRGLFVFLLQGKVRNQILIPLIALLSSLLHPLPAEWLPNLVLGLVLTGLAVRSKSVVPCFALHVTFLLFRLW